MEKVGLKSVSLEITRRCNRACEHCFRGDSQNLDMSHEIMDKFLDNVAWIDLLSITGGEPSLNCEGIRYFVDGLQKRDIFLNKAYIYTNGYHITDEFILTIQYLRNYIEQARVFDERKWKVIILVSVDKFHVGYDPMQSYRELKRTFADFDDILITISDDGDYPSDLGRAAKLPQSETYPMRKSPRLRMEIYDPQQTDLFFCPYPEVPQYLNCLAISCTVHLSALGGIYNPTYTVDYETADKMPWNIKNGNLIDVVRSYNENAHLCAKWRMDCLKPMQQEKNKIIMDTITQILHGETPTIASASVKMKIKEAETDDDENSYTMRFFTEKTPNIKDRFIGTIERFEKYKEQQVLEKESAAVRQVHEEYPQLSLFMCQRLAAAYEAMEKYENSSSMRERDLYRKAVFDAAKIKSRLRH